MDSYVEKLVININEISQIYKSKKNDIMRKI